MADTGGTNRARRLRTRRRKAAALGVGVVVLVGGGSAALAATSGSTARPVTATAVIGSVTQTVEASGVIDSSAQVSAAFAVNGTVSTVKVSQGQHVGKAQVLATLDTSSLQGSVDSANQAVATARQRLEADETGQTSSAGGTATATATASAGSQVATDSAAETPLTGQQSTAKATRPTTGTGTGKSGTAGGTLSTLVGQIAAGQQQVLAAQQAVDAGQQDVDKAQQLIDEDVTQNSTLRDAQKSACADPDGSSDGASVGSPASADCTSAQADYEAYADTLSTDVAALDKAVAAQDDNITALDAAVTALDALLNKLPAAVQSAGSATTGSTGTASGGSNSGSHGSGGNAASGGIGTDSASKQTGSSTNNSQSATKAASAAQLAADQASIDAAEAQLELARQNLKAATLTSPIAGTVASVGFTVGSGSNGQSITILGIGNQIVKINVPLSQINQVKVGQSASLAVDGRTGALHGTVTRIGLLSSTSGGSTRFPVAVTLSDGAPKLYNGIGADVTITTGTARNVVIIPNSAITTLSTRHTVTVIQGGKATITQVTLGLTGTDTSQVTTGLKAGAKVQLAVPDKDLPSSATNGTRTTRPFGGNFPGRFSGAGSAANFSGGGR